MNNIDKTSTLDTSAAPTETGASQPTLLLKSGIAKKLGKQASGGISYQILTSTSRQQLMMKITGNQGGGYVSREVVAFATVESCIDQLPQGQPFPSKLLQAAFTGRSSNNAAFLAAILRTEELLAVAPDTEGRHIISGNWAEWKASMLLQPGQPLDTEAMPETEKQVEDEAEAGKADDEKKPAIRRGKKESLSTSVTET